MSCLPLCNLNHHSIVCEELKKGKRKGRPDGWCSGDSCFTKSLGHRFKTISPYLLVEGLPQFIPFLDPHSCGSLRQTKESKGSLYLFLQEDYTLTCIGCPILAFGCGIASWNKPVDLSLCHVFCQNKASEMDIKSNSIHLTRAIFKFILFLALASVIRKTWTVYFDAQNFPYWI